MAMRDLTIKLKDFHIGNQHIANSYTRVVDGGRGKYIEFPPESINLSEIEVEPGQEYRLIEKWKSIAFYGWYRTIKTNKKVYFQYKPVDYADYLVGYYYIAPKDLEFEGDLHTEKS